MNFGWAPEWNLAFMLRVEEVLGFSLASQLGQSNITDEISWRNQSGFDGENASKKKRRRRKEEEEKDGTDIQLDQVIRMRGRNQLNSNEMN